MQCVVGFGECERWKKQFMFRAKKIYLWQWNQTHLDFPSITTNTRSDRARQRWSLIYERSKSFLLIREDYKITIAKRHKTWNYLSDKLHSIRIMKSRVGSELINYKRFFSLICEKEKYKTLIEKLWAKTKKYAKKKLSQFGFSTSLKLEACIGALIYNKTSSETQWLWIEGIYEVVRKNSVHFLPRHASTFFSQERVNLFY